MNRRATGWIGLGIGMWMSAAFGQAEDAPWVIAHRGASGYLPEHTLEAYAYAHALGADWIEPDVVLSRDGHLVCLHDVSLDRTTDAQTRFPGRAREDGRWYAIDFTLAELKQLRARGPHDDASDEGYQVATFAEVLGLIARLERETGRAVGVIPEAKRPEFHRGEGVDVVAALTRALAEAGYTGPEDAAVIQCFALEALERARAELGCGLRLVWLTGEAVPEDAWARIAACCEGIGPNRRLIEDPATGATSDLVERAHAHGLKVFPYTFDDDVEATARFFREHRVDGVFSNYPDVALRARP